MSVSRTIREDFLADEELIKEVRCRLEQGRVYHEAFGDCRSPDDTVRAVLGHLADSVQDRIRG